MSGGAVNEFIGVVIFASIFSELIWDRLTHIHTFADDTLTDSPRFHFRAMQTSSREAAESSKWKKKQHTANEKENERMSKHVERRDSDFSTSKRSIRSVYKRAASTHRVNTQQVDCSVHELIIGMERRWTCKNFDAASYKNEIYNTTLLGAMRTRMARKKVKEIQRAPAGAHGETVITLNRETTQTMRTMDQRRWLANVSSVTQKKEEENSKDKSVWCRKFPFAFFSLSLWD